MSVPPGAMPMPPPTGAAANPDQLLGLIAEAKAMAEGMPELQALLDAIEMAVVPPAPVSPEAMLMDPSIGGAL